MLKYFSTNEKGRIKLYEVEACPANYMDSVYATPVYSNHSLWKIEKPYFSHLKDNVLQDFALYDSIEDFLSMYFLSVKGFVLAKTGIQISYEDFCMKMFMEADPVVKLN